MDVAALKDRLRTEVASRADRLLELSHAIHEHPETNYEERFAHDLWYVDHCSLAVDLHILGLTVVKVLRRAGITQEGHATVEEFRGSSSLEAGPSSG